MVVNHGSKERMSERAEKVTGQLMGKNVRDDDSLDSHFAHGDSDNVCDTGPCGCSIRYGSRDINAANKLPVRIFLTEWQLTEQGYEAVLGGLLVLRFNAHIVETLHGIGQNDSFRTASTQRLFR